MGLIDFFIKLKRKRYRRNVLLTASKCGDDLKVNNKSIVTPQTQLGNNVNFNGIHIQGSGKVTIGNNFHSGIETMIITSSHNYEGETIPYDKTVISKDVLIEDNVWIGNRVIILPGTHIKEGSIIQAGSVVVGTIEKCSIAGGHPAKTFSKRDIEHYEKLKKEKKFH